MTVDISHSTIELRYVDLFKGVVLMSSKILDFIRNNPDTWEELLSDKLIRVSRRGNLVCFKYTTEADFSDPIVCEARGIIVDLLAMKVVCWPFDKFFNVQESYAAKIDWSSARVLEKVDGSLIKLYWYDGEWRFATSSTCDAAEANISGSAGYNFKDILAKAINFENIPFDKLDKDYTYMFELVSPMTQIVVKYKLPQLFFLAARNNNTGEEIDADMGNFARPQSYKLNSLEDCLNAAIKLNEGCGDSVEREGFVVVDSSFKRIKIKSPEYVAMHKITTNKIFTVKRITELYFEGIDLHEFTNKFPLEARILKYYDWQISEMKFKIENMMVYARKLYEEYDHDRKAVAKSIGTDPYSWVGFAALGNDKTVDDMLTLLTPGKMEKYIKEYKY